MNFRVKTIMWWNSFKAMRKLDLMNAYEVVICSRTDEFVTLNNKIKKLEKELKVTIEVLFTLIAWDETLGQLNIEQLLDKLPK